MISAVLCKMGYLRHFISFRTAGEISLKLYTTEEAQFVFWRERKKIKVNLVLKSVSQSVVSDRQSIPAGARSAEPEDEGE
jgi:hypothetical protein